MRIIERRIYRSARVRGKDEGGEEMLKIRNLTGVPNQEPEIDTNDETTEVSKVNL